VILLPSIGYDKRPNIILLDLVMPGFSPSAFEKWARENYPETITLVLTSHDRDAYLGGMMEAGATNKFISKKLQIAPTTVEKHLARIYKKLAVTSRAEAALWGSEHGRDFEY